MAELPEGSPFTDRYSLVRRLAVGGMAEIYLAQQHGMAEFQKEVVIKRLSDRYASDERVLDMFLDEARIGAVLSHPNVVQVFDVGEQAGHPYIAMEYIEGDELANVCRRGLANERFLPMAHACDVIRQAAEGLGYVHARRDAAGTDLKIVHRDISPSNLLITDGGTVKLIDFGIATSVVQRRVESGMVPGKYHYMSPEQVQGERVDHRSDIFSLGIVLYEITTSRRLFKGAPELVMQKIVKESIKPPTFKQRDYPPALELIVMRALERHPDDRYQSAYELAQDLGDFIRDEKLKTGHIRLARYLEDLKGAEGKEVRPELAELADEWKDPEDEADALGFDRGIFDDMAPATGGTTQPNPKVDDAWDDGDDDGPAPPVAVPVKAAPVKAAPAPGPELRVVKPEPERAAPPVAEPVKAVVVAAKNGKPGQASKAAAPSSVPAPAAPLAEPVAKPITQPLPASARGEPAELPVRLILIVAVALAIALAAFIATR